MALKAVIDTAEELEAVPEALRESYVEADGHWYLSIEGQTRREAELGSKVSEFRETNVGLMKEKSTIADQLETVTQRYSGVDPALYQEMMGERQKRLLRLIPRTKGRAVAHREGSNGFDLY